MGVGVGQSPRCSLASFICHHHGIYTNVASWLLTLNFSLEIVYTLKNGLWCSMYRYMVDEWATRRMSHSGSLQWAVQWNHKLELCIHGMAQLANYEFPRSILGGMSGHGCFMPDGFGYDMWHTFPLKAGVLGSIAALLYELLPVSRFLRPSFKAKVAYTYQ